MAAADRRLAGDAPARLEVVREPAGNRGGAGGITAECNSRLALWPRRLAATDCRPPEARVEPTRPLASQEAHKPKEVSLTPFLTPFPNYPGQGPNAIKDPNPTISIVMMTDREVTAVYECAQEGDALLGYALTLLLSLCAAVRRAT